MHYNIEIKARCNNPSEVVETLGRLGARFIGVDNQKDIYFASEKGRVKLREGNIENALIFYERSDQAGPRPSVVTMCSFSADSSMLPVLSRILETKVVVEKERAIYFIENVKFHIDKVAGLGSFLEIEAIDLSGSIGKEKLYEQCRHYMRILNINQEDLIHHSYSDMKAE